MRADPRAIKSIKYRERVVVSIYALFSGVFGFRLCGNFLAIGTAIKSKKSSTIRLRELR